MYSEIEVKDVLTENDCSGQLQLYVTAQHADEIIASKFRLTPVYMLPHEKLSLVNVLPQDRVTVYAPYKYLPNSPHLEDYLVAGEYLKNNSQSNLYHPQCFCGDLLYSDGSNIECRNLDCTLTLKARLKQLSRTSFFEPPFIFYDENGKSWFDDNGFDNLNQTNPFSTIMTESFWKYNNNFPLENVLKQYQYHYAFEHNQLDLSDFLISDKFEHLLCKIHYLHLVSQQDPTRASAILHSLKVQYKPILNVHSRLKEITHHRDMSCDWQNKLLKAFLKGLGLKTLTDDVIDDLVDNETQYWAMAALDSFCSLAVLLNTPAELVKTLGYHPIRAHQISQEVSKRQKELCDIFCYYSECKEDVESLFYKRV